MTSQVSVPIEWLNALAASLPPGLADRMKLDIFNTMQAASRLSQWDPTSTGILTADWANKAGSVRVDADGLHIYNGTAETMWFKSIGDALIGSNITAAATTNFVFLSTAQTYNSEALGAGDLLIGDNSASKANVLWDASAGILYFRGGTTNQGWINTTGSATFGEGNVTLDALGISIAQGQGTYNAVNWYLGSDIIGRGVCYAIGTGSNQYGALVLDSFPETSAALGTVSLTLVEAFVADGDGTNSIGSYLELTGEDAILLGGAVSATYVALKIDGSAGTLNLSADASLTTSVASFSASGVIFNDDSQDRDFRVESNGNANMLVVDGGVDGVGIGVVPTTRFQTLMEGATFYPIWENVVDSADSANYLFRKARGSAAASKGAVQNGDSLAKLLFQGWDGTSYESAALITATVGGAPGDGDMPGQIDFWTTPDGSITLTAALSILSDQTLKFQSANSFTANGTATVTISNVAPAGVGTATISKWLTVVDNAGTTMYIPAWT